MSNRSLVVIAAVLAATLLGLAFFWQPALPDRPLPRAALPAGGDLTLQTADGPRTLADFRGKLVLICFGYTYCPDVCPTSLAATAEGVARLTAEEQARLALLFISVDPARDDVARLKEYAAFFHPAMVGGTASPAEIAAIASRYGVFYARQSAATAGGGYVVDHTSDTYVVDAGGKLVDKIPHAAPPEVVVDMIRKHLKPL